MKILEFLIKKIQGKFTLLFVYLLDMKELKYGKETREEIISKKTFNRKFWNMRMVVVSTAAMT